MKSQASITLADVAALDPDALPTVAACAAMLLSIDGLIVDLDARIAYSDADIAAGRPPLPDRPEWYARITTARARVGHARDRVAARQAELAGGLRVKLGAMAGELRIIIASLVRDRIHRQPAEVADTVALDKLADRLAALV